MDNQETLFTKIIKRDIAADIIYEDDLDLCLAFKDISPQAPSHVLLIPKVVIPRLVDAKAEHKEILGHLMLKAGHIATLLGIGDDFRVVINNGAGACQSVFHLHMHIMGGRNFTWPPG